MGITLFLALISILCGSVAQLFLKRGITVINLDLGRGIWQIITECVTNLHIWIGITCYGISLVFWVYVLSRIELGRAYPMVSLGYIFTLLLSHYYLGEEITLLKVCGIFLIIFGVICLVGSK